MKLPSTLFLIRAQPRSPYYSTWTDPTAAPPMYGQSSNSTQGSSSGTRTASGKAKDFQSPEAREALTYQKYTDEIQQAFFTSFTNWYRWASNSVPYFCFLWKQGNIYGGWNRPTVGTVPLVLDLSSPARHISLRLCPLVCTSRALLQQTCIKHDFFVESMLPNLQEQNAFSGQLAWLLYFMWICLAHLTTFSLFRAGEPSGKAVVELTLFFFFCRLWRHKTEMKPLILLHLSAWTKSYCVLLIFFVSNIRLQKQTGGKEWEWWQRVPLFPGGDMETHSCLGYHKCWNFHYFKTVASLKTQNKLIQVKNDVTVTVYLSVFEGLCKW